MKLGPTALLGSKVVVLMWFSVAFFCVYNFGDDLIACPHRLNSVWIAES